MFLRRNGYIEGFGKVLHKAFPRKIESHGFRDPRTSGGAFHHRAGPSKTDT